MSPEDLVAQARAAREGAYAPYSNYRVGAALLAASGQVYTGCNVENASYGLTICAERVAYVKAVSAGEMAFRELAVVTEGAASMCGACRQVAREFGEALLVHLSRDSRSFRSTTLAKLLPESFGPSTLEI
ncbi:MAG: cytidine deaminase [Planctomycetes bacterium]|nr:cytidine deaminase [Planctomycetota bacterium]